jgi:hypothetical protein
MLLIFYKIFSRGVRTKSVASLEKIIAAPARITQTKIVLKMESIALTSALQ